MYACGGTHIDVVKKLLERKDIDINARNINGETALLIASKARHNEIVKLLLEQEGIEVDEKDRYTKAILKKLNKPDNVKQTKPQKKNCGRKKK